MRIKVLGNELVSHFVDRMQCKNQTFEEIIEFIETRRVY